MTQNNIFNSFIKDMNELINNIDDNTLIRFSKKRKINKRKTIFNYTSIIYESMDYNDIPINNNFNKNNRQYKKYRLIQKMEI
jgi:hypothetical protein